uniref:Carboxylic ester hydrolase n=1 Tax=Plutella xylostella TaxID=51655 RepID=A0A1L8D6H6_PLUXY
MRVLLLTSILYTVQCYVSGAQVRVDPLVLIDQGLVRGQKALDGDYSSFLGIPYAQVDTANPFGPSLPAPKFDTIFNASNGDIACPQPRADSQSLDCLRLNIFVPSRASVNHPLPVFIYIHGGGFRDGYASKDSPTGHNLVAQDIIVVSINYRLGPYGFLCLDIPEVPGNQGLKDQYTALQWVKKNIAHFGGNANDVTIAGESAGAAAVVYQLYADNEKLFNKVIVQSGAPQSPGLLADGDTAAALKLAQHLGYLTDDNKKALEFLTNTSSDLVIGAMDATGFNVLPYPLYIENNLKAFNLSEEELREATEVVKHFYLGDEPVSEATALSLDLFNSDFGFVNPTELAVKQLLSEEAGPIYQYVFSFVSERDGDTAGATHASELKYVFADGYDSFTEDEKTVSDHFTFLWSNFIKYGNPTPEATERMPFTWQPVTSQTRPYVDIDVAVTARSRFRGPAMVFWELFYKRFGLDSVV